MRRLRNLVPFTSHAGTVALALFAYFATIVGYPVPRPAPQDTGRTSVCQHRACGCQGAEPCEGCRCCSPVILPAHAAPCCALGEANTDLACADCAPAETTAPPLTWVIGRHVNQCRGQITDWFSQGAALPILRATWTHDWVPLEWVRLPALLQTSHITPPDTPPPRG